MNKRTPLYDTHVASGARMIPFGGWDMPVQYSEGIIHEVQQVRNDVGIFDVSHMARLSFREFQTLPKNSMVLDFLDRVLSVRASELKSGHGKYHVICNEEGGIIDDAIVYNLDFSCMRQIEDYERGIIWVPGIPNIEFMLVTNAGNADAVRSWLGLLFVLSSTNAGNADAVRSCLEELSEHSPTNDGRADAVRSWLIQSSERWPWDVGFRDITDATAMIAVQGPRAVELLESISSRHVGGVGSIDRFGADELFLNDLLDCGCYYCPCVLGSEEICDHDCTEPCNWDECTCPCAHLEDPAKVVRTGYTGEDGFEIICDTRLAVPLWNKLIDAGATPCGLGARDVLRLEAGLMLHGVDMTVENNPYEAGLRWTVRPNRAEYIAGPALRRIRDEGTSRIITGFEMRSRGIARHGHKIFVEGDEAGVVTSGTYSPTLGKAIAMGYIDVGHTALGTEVVIDVRGRLVDAEVVELPFYRCSS